MSVYLMEEGLAHSTEVKASELRCVSLTYVMLTDQNFMIWGLSPATGKEFSLRQNVRMSLGTIPFPIQWLLGTKWPGCEVDHLPPSKC